MLLSRLDHDHFGMMPAFDVLGLGDALRRHCLGMVQCFVTHFVFIQTIDQSFWYFHRRLAEKSITFLMYLYFLNKASAAAKGGCIERLRFPLRNTKLNTAAELTRRETFVYGYM